MKHAAYEFSGATLASGVKTTFVRTLGLNLVDDTLETAIDALLSPGRRRVCFMNAHCCNVMQYDRQYAMAVRSADVLLPDGIGVALAGKIDGCDLTANLNGTDLIPALLERAALQGKSVYLFGGTPGTAQTAAINLVARIPALRIVGVRDGFEGAVSDEAAIADINASGADIVLVAMGVPLQDNWLFDHSNRLNASLMMGVGAAFDFFAGNVARAPRWVRRMRSEWVWRLAIEPRRLAKRYLAGNFSFLARAMFRKAALTSGQDVARKTLDVAISAFALLTFAPIFLVTAIAIRLDSTGPVLFRQTRIGKSGKPFTMYKFRSMVKNAEDLRADVLEQTDREGVCFKSKTDPRITKVGRFIRRASIDELPQLLNVLRGEMSIVGPRPSLPCEYDAYPQRAFGRLAVKPGITGVWQVSGRADISFDQMIDMDLAYARSRTILLDLVVIALTFRAVLSARGAH